MKFHRVRDTRHKNGDKVDGLRMSVSIEAESAAEADAIFEERWKQREIEMAQALAERVPLLDAEQLRAIYLSPEALRWKKEHPGQLRP